MGLFENTIERARDVIDVAGKKGGEILNVQKLKLDAARLNSQISNDFESLGRLVYANLQDNIDPKEGINAIVDLITEKYAQLEVLDTKISESKGLKKCDYCGAENPIGSFYCAKCGNPLHVEPKQDDPADAEAEAPAAPSDGETAKETESEA